MDDKSLDAGKKYFILIKLIDRFTVQGIKISYERLTKHGKCWWLAAVQVFKYSPLFKLNYPCILSY